jgi:DNA-directed RNA polymerase specialized sigma24 family protein
MLSERGQAILRLVGIPTWAGWSAREIGREFGISRSSVSSLLAELRDEIERLSV